MIVNLLTDAPKHNHALMKISTYHKLKGDKVYLNYPFVHSDLTYVSLLFEKSISLYDGDIFGGPAYFNKQSGIYKGSLLSKEIESCKPNYDLYNLDYSIGYTFRPCYRNCSFCKVGSMPIVDKEHHSIWDFHDKRFNKICLLNNNTFMDKNWKDTFNEIWDEKLTIIDENGYDLRLIDDEKAEMLKRTKFQGKIHFAWDRIKDEEEIIRGLKILKKYKVHGTVYVLIGYDTNEEENLHRCQILKDLGFDIYIMPYGATRYGKSFKRFIDSFMWRKYKSIAEAWKDYKPNIPKEEIQVDNDFIN